MDNLIKRVIAGENLLFDEMTDFFDAMVNEQLTDAQVGAALVALRMKGENEVDLAAAATVLNKYKIKIDGDLKNKIDTCGTGGDGKSTINVSTIVSIVLGSFGFNVVKHGNVAQSGKVGSADILELLGIPVKLTKDEVEKYLQKHNFVFLFAPNYHPILKSVGKIRRELRVPTIFNYLGPMLNPAEPDFQLIGINSVQKLDVYASALKQLGRNNILVVSSKDGFDEISSSDVTFARRLKDGVIESFEIDPADFFNPFEMPKVSSNDDAVNLFLRAIQGEDENLSNLIALNTAFAMSAANENNVNENFEKVKVHLQKGAVKRYFESLKG